MLKDSVDSISLGRCIISVIIVEELLWLSSIHVQRPVFIWAAAFIFEAVVSG